MISIEIHMSILNVALLPTTLTVAHVSTAAVERRISHQPLAALLAKHIQSRNKFNASKMMPCQHPPDSRALGVLKG